jgi:peptidase E
MRKKIYLLAGGPGGSRKTAEQLKTALLSSGSRSPSVAYIGTASGDSRSFMKWFERPLKEAGAHELRMVPLLGRKADRNEADKILDSSDVIFISGGEVEDGMNGLDPTMRRHLRQLLEGGKLFIGLSAGSIMMCRAWPHWDDEDNHPEDASLFDCLGFASEIFDTHAEAEGWPELKKAVELEPEGFAGYGIPSGEMAVIGENGILMQNANLVKVVNRSGLAVVETAPEARKNK